MQMVPPSAVKAFDKVNNWNSPFRIIVDERYYVVDKVYGRDDRVRSVMNRGNEALGINDLQERNVRSSAQRSTLGLPDILELLVR